ncbi:MAG: VOC family protein [Symploca sp. SIO1C2]|nr:VOC family protein [Symploca sp. SIO1C2]
MVTNINIQSTRLKVEKAYRKVINTVIAVFAISFVLLGSPGLTSSALAGPGGTTVEGTVIRFDVQNVKKSVEWYTEVLDMKEAFGSDSYAQVFYPEQAETQIGLSQNDYPQSGTATATLVVNDIFAAQNSIFSKGWYVEDLCASSEYTPEIVLAFFCDPDGNNLALRQDDFMFEILLPVCGAPMCSNY